MERNSDTRTKPFLKLMQEKQDNTCTNEDEYDFVDETWRGGDVTKAKHAHMDTYRFPGTFETAYLDTKDATFKVGDATKSFASAVARSGITKASWSIGAFAASAISKGAAYGTSGAVTALGVENKLPSFARNWVKSATKNRGAKKRAAAKDSRRAILAQNCELPSVSLADSGEDNDDGDDMEEDEVENISQHEFSCSPKLTHQSGISEGKGTTFTTAS